MSSFFFLNFQSQNFTKINNVNIYDFSTLHSKTPPPPPFQHPPPPPPPLYKLKYMRYYIIDSCFFNKNGSLNLPCHGSYSKVFCLKPFGLCTQVLF